MGPKKPRQARRDCNRTRRIHDLRSGFAKKRPRHRERPTVRREIQNPAASRFAICAYVRRGKLLEGRTVAEIADRQLSETIKQTRWVAQSTYWSHAFTSCRKTPTTYTDTMTSWCSFLHSPNKPTVTRWLERPHMVGSYAGRSLKLNKKAHTFLERLVQPASKHR